MAITVVELKALSFGYLTGADLLQWCAAQLLIKQIEVDPNSLQRGADFAYAEVTAKFRNRYDIKGELLKTATDRETLCVKVTALLAVENALGNMANISDTMASYFKKNAKDILDIRNGQSNLAITAPVVPPSGVPIQTLPELVNTSFSTLG